MESKVNLALLKQAFMNHHAWLRNRFINENEFESAMTQHFFWLFAVDEYFELRRSMTEEENTKFMLASNCYD